MVIGVQILFLYLEEESEGSIQLYVLHHRWGVKTPHNMCTATGTRIEAVPYENTCTRQDKQDKSKWQFER